VRTLVRLLMVALALLLAGLAVACDGGGGDEQAPPELGAIPTATPPDTLPEVRIVDSVDGNPAGGRTYVVQDGDLLGEIADQFGVTVEAIIAANDPLDPTVLVVGQVLIIPDSDGNVLGATDEPTQAPADTPTPQPSDDVVIYVVQEGDIPETIAAQFGITAEELMAANGITDPTSLNIGDELIIPQPSQ